MLSKKDSAFLLLSIFLVAACGLGYELTIGAISSYLRGNSVTQFSLTIGFFLCAMGIGAWISRHITAKLLTWFIRIELTLAIVGGLAGTIMFLAFPLAPRLALGVQLSLTLIIGSFVGLEIPLLTRLLTEQGQKNLRSSISEVLSIDYLGALAGSLVFPLLLLPKLGLLPGCLLIGTINSAVGLSNAFAFARHDRSIAKLRPIAVIIFLASLTLLFAGSRIASMAESHLYADAIVFQQKSNYQKITFTQAVNGEHRLYLDGHLQFSEKDEYRYHEALVHPAMAPLGAKENVLVLGGGDGLALREILKYPEVTSVYLVDIDPAITKLATEFAPLQRMNGNALADPRVHVHHADAMNWTRHYKGPPFDRVCIDFPDPHDAALAKLYSREMFLQLKKICTQECWLCIQSGSPFFTPKCYWMIAKTMYAAGWQIRSHHVTIPSFGGPWGFHLARLQNFPYPEENPAKIPVETRFFNDRHLVHSRYFPEDLQADQEDLAINTLMQPHLYQLHEAELNP